MAELKTLSEAAGINSKTADAYQRPLRNLFVVDTLPAWTSNRLKRPVRAPKHYLVDSALAAGVLGMEVDAVLRDGDLLGRLLETFVVAQLRAELSICSARFRLYRLRDAGGRHEVDVVAELGAHRVIGIEVKASSPPRSDAARHLRWLRDGIGDVSPLAWCCTLDRMSTRWNATSPQCRSAPCGGERDHAPWTAATVDHVTAQRHADKP